MENEKSQMNALLTMVGPLMPTIKPNNRDKFWSKNRCELERIGWTGKYIYSDSDEDSEEGDDKVNNHSSSCSTLDDSETSSTVTEQERDDYYHNTSWEDYWNDVYFPDHSDISESGLEDDNDDWQEVLFNAEQFAENTIMNWVGTLLFLLAVQGGI